MKTTRLSSWVSGNASALVIITLLRSAALSGYGQAGALDADYQPAPSYVVSAVAIQTDGKVLIGGGFQTVSGLERRFLARLNTNGTVDAGFVPANIEGGEVRAVALQPDGKVLVGGQFARVGESFTSQVARLQTNGAVDPTFNSTLNGYSYFRAFARQSDGKVLVATDDGLDRLLPDGGRDTNFQQFAAWQWITNGDGMTSAHNSLRAVAELSDGKILIGGDLQAIAGLALGAGVIRLNADGSWDPSFQRYTNGAASTLLVQPDGKIVVGRNGGLARVNTDGTMDNSFAPQSIEGDVMTLARQPDGKILVGGYYQRAAGWLRPGIARFNSDGTLDRNFDAGDVSGFTVTSVALQANAEILIGGYFTSLNGQDRPYVARLHNDNPNFPGRFEFLSVSNAVAEAAGSLVIPVVRYAGSAGTASVVVATDWGSAFPGVDYLSRTQTLVFLPGQTSNSFTVPILDDAQVEGPYGWEAFSVQLSAPGGGATLGSEKRAIGYILEDDTAIGFASSGVGADEADGQAVINLVRLGVTSSAVSAFYQTENGTAVAPGDFTAQSGTVAFAPGETNKSISVPLNDDALVEGGETFSLRLSAPTGGASLATTNVTVYITDDVSFLAFDANPTVTETDGHVTLTVRRWGRTNNTVSAHYATSNLTAHAGTDYVTTSGTLTLLPGQNEGSITVPILDDSAVEDMEQLQVALHEPAGTLVLPYWSTATVSLISDDGAGYPDTRFRPVVPGERVDELALCPGGKILVRGDLFVTNGTVRPTLLRYHPDGAVDSAFQPNLEGQVYSMAASPDGKVYVVTGLGTGTSVKRLLADGQPDATFDPFHLDYTASPPSYPARALAVQADGKLLVSAYPGTYYGYETTTNFLNRLNADGSYDLAFGPVSQLGEEQLAKPPNAVALQPDGGILLAATFTTTNGVTRNRVVRLTEAGQLDTTFSPPPEVTGDVREIRPLANGKLFLYGTFTAINGTPRFGAAVIAADGSLDSDFISPFRPYEYFEAGITAVTVQSDGKAVFSGGVRLTNGTTLSLGRLNLNGSLDTNFHMGSSYSSYVWDLALQGDGKVLLGGSSGPFFGAGLERLNNDPAVAAGSVEFTVASQNVSETNTSVTVALRRVGGTNGLVRVRYATISGPAAASDLIPQTGIIEFAAGEAGEKLIRITLLDDTVAEGDESFSVSLGRPVGGAPWGQVATTTITMLDNDQTMQFAANQLRVRENQGSQTVEVQRLGGAAGVVTVAYSSRDGSAQAGLDYTSGSGTLTFADGETNKSFVVSILEDALPEADETIQLLLSSPTAGVLLGTNATAELTIVDNDRPGTLDPTFNPGGGFCEGGFYGYGLVYTLALQRDGGILAGGSFSYFNGAACFGRVRLLPDGSMDLSFDATSIYLYDVRNIALQPDGKVIVSTGDRLGRFNSDGSPDPSFGLIDLGYSRIRALQLQPDGKVLIAGSFQTVNGTLRNGLARLNPDGSLDESFAPDLKSEVHLVEVASLAVGPDGRIIFAGTFDTVNGAIRHGLARLNADGSLDPSFDAGTGLANEYGYPCDAYPNAIVIQPDSKVLLGGQFARVNGVLRTNLVRLHPDGSVDNAFSANVAHFYNYPAPVRTLALQPDNKVLIGGAFTSVNGVFRNGVARLNPDGSLDADFYSGDKEPAPYSYFPFVEVYALALQPDGQIVVGGNFNQMDGEVRCGIARLNGTRRALTPSQAVQALMAKVNASSLAVQQRRPLLATLQAALASLERTNTVSGINQLQAFQNKVRAQVRPVAPGLAADLVQAAQAIIDALQGQRGRPHFISATKSPPGKFKVKFAAAPGRAYLVQASTNLTDWITVGVATELGTGAFEFEDTEADKFAGRFYRVATP